MKTSNLKSGIFYTVGFVLLLWCIKSAEILFKVDLTGLGVMPRELTGLIGVFSAPLVHGSLEHLFNNTLPLLILGSFILYGYPVTRYRVIVSVWIISGIGVWLFARQASHIGASGLTHGLFFYLLVVSMFRRDKSSIAIMMIAFFLYGGMTMTIFPREPGISFEYHFFGAVSGTLCAFLWHKKDPKPDVKLYKWEKHPEIDDPVIGDQWQTDHQEQQDYFQYEQQNDHKRHLE